MWFVINGLDVHEYFKSFQRSAHVWITLLMEYEQLMLSKEIPGRDMIAKQDLQFPQKIRQSDGVIHMGKMNGAEQILYALVRRI